MKTCSFRQAAPRSLDEGLFCLGEPERRYGLSARNHCSLCSPRYNITSREELGPMIRFSPQHGFRFYNDYETMLNCPADCHTRNLIYVMVCPCHRFEYIGETSQRLRDRLRCKFFSGSLNGAFIFSQLKIIGKISIESFMNSYWANTMFN